MRRAPLVCRRRNSVARSGHPQGGHDRRFRGAIADNPVVRAVLHSIQRRVRTVDGDPTLNAADHVLLPAVQVVQRFQWNEDVRVVGEVDLPIDRLAESDSKAGPE